MRPANNHSDQDQDDIKFLMYQMKTVKTELKDFLCQCDYNII